MCGIEISLEGIKGSKRNGNKWGVSWGLQLCALSQLWVNQLISQLLGVYIFIPAKEGFGEVKATLFAGKYRILTKPFPLCHVNFHPTRLENLQHRHFYFPGAECRPGTSRCFSLFAGWMEEWRHCKESSQRLLVVPWGAVCLSPARILILSELKHQVTLVLLRK